MTAILNAHRTHVGEPEYVTVEQFDLTYANLDDCDPDLDIALVETDGVVVGYARTSVEDLLAGRRDFVVFFPVHPDHVGQPLFEALVKGEEAHMRHRWRTGTPTGRFRAYARHPGPGLEAEAEARWLEQLGYSATEWEAFLVRPHLDDIPERPLPDGVVVRPVTEDQVRPILAAHFEAFRGEWDFSEPTESDFVAVIDDPNRDISLWKVAWAGDTVVGQVKSYIDTAENADRNIRRGYTEQISCHPEWRNRGIAGALLAMSLHELRQRGLSEAALGVDTNNPGGAFHLYTALGFELQSYEAIYMRPVD
jgi:ribosomal protein S18 acetylase RimI-like enzyme